MFLGFAVLAQFAVFRWNLSTKISFSFQKNCFKLNLEAFVYFFPILPVIIGYLSHSVFCSVVRAIAVRAIAEKSLQDHTTKCTLQGRSKDLGLCLTLAERRENLCLRTVKNIYKEGGCLSRHLPLDKTHSYNTRNCNSLNLIPCRTERLRGSFFPSSVKLLNQHK